jgi:hypothetical protein
VGGRKKKVAEELGATGAGLQRDVKIMGQKVQCQLLAGRGGGAAGSQVEPVCAEDDRVENQRQDDVEGQTR